jgi:hypothetical protein
MPDVMRRKPRMPRMGLALEFVVQLSVNSKGHNESIQHSQDLAKATAPLCLYSKAAPQGIPPGPVMSHVLIAQSRSIATGHMRTSTQRCSS